MKPERGWILLPTGKQLYLLGAEQWAWIGEDLATGLSRTTISRCAFRRRPCHAIVFRRQHPPNPPRLGAAPLSGFIARLEDVVRPGYPALNSAAAPNLRSCIGQRRWRRTWMTWRTQSPSRGFTILAWPAAQTCLRHPLGLWWTCSRT